jgi:LuxR family maltose regulon positive regulatory protein
MTAAELRLLPNAVHPPVSARDRRRAVPVAHTIKAQMRSIYRKLSVSSRSQAVTRARELGLLQG